MKWLTHAFAVDPRGAADRTEQQRTLVEAWVTALGLCPPGASAA